MVPILDKMVLKAVGIDAPNANQDINILRRYLPNAWGLSDKYAIHLCDVPNITAIRLIDMALWVDRNSKSILSSDRNQNICRRNEMISAPITRRSVPPLRESVLQGEIRGLCQVTSDHWARREIIFQQRKDGFPELRTNLSVVDTNGRNYTLPCIKGANKQGYALFGQPGRLRTWFEEHYPKDRVIADDVYLEILSSNDIVPQVRLFTSKEWFQKNEIKGSDNYIW